MYSYEKSIQVTYEIAMYGFVRGPKLLQLTAAVSDEECMHTCEKKDETGTSSATIRFLAADTDKTLTSALSKK